MAHFNMAAACKAYKRLQRSQQNAYLEADFRNLMQHANPNDVASKNRLVQMKNLVRAIDDERVQGSILRSKEK